MQNIFHFCVSAAASVFLNANKFNLRVGSKQMSNAVEKLCFWIFFYENQLTSIFVNTFIFVCIYINIVEWMTENIVVSLNIWIIILIYGNSRRIRTADRIS